MERNSPNAANCCIWQLSEQKTKGDFLYGGDDWRRLHISRHSSYLNMLSRVSLVKHKLWGCTVAWLAPLCSRGFYLHSAMKCILRTNNEVWRIRGGHFSGVIEGLSNLSQKIVTSAAFQGWRPIRANRHRPGGENRTLFAGMRCGCGTLRNSKTKTYRLIFVYDINDEMILGVLLEAGGTLSKKMTLYLKVMIIFLLKCPRSKMMRDKNEI